MLFNQYLNRRVDIYIENKYTTNRNPEWRHYFEAQESHQTTLKSFLKLNT